MLTLPFFNFFTNLQKIRSPLNLIFFKKITQVPYFPNRLFFSSKEKTKFRPSNFNFFSLSDSYVTFNTGLKNLYNLKKNVYSFPFKNEIKKYILRKYTKSFFIPNSFNNNRFFNFNKFSNLGLTANQNYDFELNYSNELFFLINQNVHFSSN